MLCVQFLLLSFTFLTQKRVKTYMNHHYSNKNKIWKNLQSYHCRSGSSWKLTGNTEILFKGQE